MVPGKSPEPDVGRPLVPLLFSFPDGATPISPGILLNRWVLKWHGPSIHNKDLEL